MFRHLPGMVLYPDCRNIFVIGTGLVAFLPLVVCFCRTKNRILNFVDMRDIHGSGYNASHIYSCSAHFRQVGYGNQSLLEVPPEYQTDLYLCRFLKVLGFSCVVLLLLCFGVVIR